MTFTAEHDLRFKLQFALLVLCGGVTLGAFLLYGNMIALMASLPLLLSSGIVAMQLFRTVYTLDGTLLNARSGLSRVLVDYKDITLVTDSRDTPVNGYVPLATSANKLYVIYTQDGKSYRLELSPRDRTGFADALGEKLG